MKANNMYESNETSVLANGLIANRSMVRRKYGPTCYEDDGVIRACALLEVIELLVYRCAT